MGKVDIQFPWWKKVLSYLTEIPLEASSSDLNEFLQVSLVKGRLQLCTQDAIYSYDDKYGNFYECFQQIRLPTDGSELMVYGLGLGSIPYMLEHNFNKNYRYTAIEIDEEIIYLYSKYTSPRCISSISVIQADARVYAYMDDKKYDLICLDIFQSQLIPEECLSLEFLDSIKNSLLPGGQVIMNMMAATPKDRQSSKKYIDEVFSQVFKDYKVLTIKGNYLLLSTKSMIKA